MTHRLLSEQQLHLLSLTQQPMLGHQVMLQHVKQQLVLTENLEPVSTHVTFLLATQLVYKVLRLLVQHEYRVLSLRLCRSHQKEFTDPLTGFDCTIDVLRSDLLPIEIEKDSNRRIDLLVLLDLQWRENLPLIDQFLPLIKLIELSKGHILGLLLDNELAVVQNLQDGLVHAETTTGLSLQSQLQLAMVIQGEITTTRKHVVD